MPANRFRNPRPDHPLTTLLGLLTSPAAAGLTLADHRAMAAGACALALAVFLRLRWRLCTALTDPVTGLPTRVTAERYLSRANGSHRTLAITDVKDLRGVNSRWG